MTWTLPTTLGDGYEYEQYEDYDGLSGDYGDSLQEDNPSVRTAIVLLNGSFTLDCYGGEGRHSGHRLVHNGQVVDQQILTRRAGLMRQKSSSSQSVSYRLSQASESDSGSWACTSKHGHGGHQRDETSLVMVVVVAGVNVPVMILDGVVVKNNSVITRAEYSSLDLKCAIIQVPSDPPLGRHGWRLGEEPVGESSQLVVTTDDQYNVHSILRLEHFSLDRSHHGKELSCHLGSERVMLVVHVDYQPEFTISRLPVFGQPVLEHMTVSLKCTVDSQPTSQPVWTREGETVPSIIDQDNNTAELRWGSIRSSEEGWYQCETFHKLGNFSSVGYYLSVRAGETKTGVGVTDGGVTQEVGLTDQVLIMGEAEQRKADCPGQMSTGEEESARPRVTAVSGNITASVGENVSLIVRLCANPPPAKMFWVGPDVLIRPGQTKGRFSGSTVRDDTMCWRAVLEIGPVMSQDGGEYSLIVKNWYGIQDGSVWLNIKEYSEDYVETNASVTVKEIHAVTISLLISFHVLLLAQLK